MAPDGVIDWNQVTWFQFGSAHSAPRLTQLTIERFIEHLGGVRKLSPELLTRTLVRALRADDSIAHEWPAFRCMQAELKLDGKTYLLNSGKWYQLDENFVAAVNRSIEAISTCDLGLPEYQDTTEGKYNERVAGASGDNLALLDADTVRHGGGQSQIEFCDLYSRQRDIIHVKRYSGSSVLSHLFSQAAVSGQAFRSDEDFRKKVNSKLPPSHKIPNTKTNPNAGDYRVVIAIVGGPLTCVELPFFSRVTLKNSTRLLSALGFRVAVSHIPLEARFAITESLRERATRQRRKASKSVGSA